MLTLPYSFHVIIPSLPGYFQSTLPPRDGFNLADIARVYNAFMVDLLKYNLYAIQANDWVRLSPVPSSFPFSAFPNFADTDAHDRVQ